MNNLKQLLLDLNVFIDNKYLDLYCSLIQKNLNTKKEVYKTQEHHFIPVCFYKYKYNLKNLNESKKLYANQDKNNFLVNLNYTDHILAHYYLVLICNEEFKKLKWGLNNAFLHLVNRKYNYNNFNPEKDLEEFNQIYNDYMNSLKRENRNAGRKIICIETGQIFKNISYVDDWLGKKRYTCAIRPALIGEQKSSNGYHWAYADETEKIKELKKLYYNKDKINYHKKIYCLELNEIFNSGAECAKYFKDNLNINLTPYYCCNKRCKTVKGYHFCYFEDKEKFNFIKEKDGRIAREGHPVICLETGVEYVSIGKAVKDTGINTIGACCNKVRGYPRAGGLHWCFKENYEVEYKKFCEENNNLKN